MANIGIGLIYHLLYREQTLLSLCLRFVGFTLLFAAFACRIKPVDALGHSVRIFSSARLTVVACRFALCVPPGGPDAAEHLPAELLAAQHNFFSPLRSFSCLSLATATEMGGVKTETVGSL